MNNIELNPATQYLYTLFLWSASDCSPNRDGGTGAIRTDMHRRVFITQESFNQNVKNGLFFSSNGIEPGAEPVDGAVLMGCKNEFFGARTLRQALESVRDQIAEETKKEPDAITGEDLFCHCFDIPAFGYVNSNGLENHPAFPHNLPGSAGLIYLPKTVTQVEIENRGISNAFSQPKSGTDSSPKGMPGSHFTDYLVEGVFVTLGIFNVKQLRIIAREKFGMADDDRINTRIGQLYTLYLRGIWEGYKLLGYVSTMRKGQQPLALYSSACETLPDFIANPADLLMDPDKHRPPLHESIDATLESLRTKLSDWARIFPGGFQKVAGRDIL
ncbi:MAG: hypothetical protein ACLFSZ_00325 [Puniceicoccaceae bacterium]